MLFNPGSVGSQSLLGLPMIHRLSQLPGSRSGPLPRRIAPVVLAEVYPSLIAGPVAILANAEGLTADQAQVRLLSRALYRLARQDRLAPLFDAPPEAPRKAGSSGPDMPPAGRGAGMAVTIYRGLHAQPSPAGGPAVLGGVRRQAGPRAGAGRTGAAVLPAGDPGRPLLCRGGGRGRIDRIAGFKTPRAALRAGWDDLTEVYGRWGGRWRGGVLWALGGRSTTTAS
jgi:hypothetical protein